METKIDGVALIQEQNPSLLWLIRYKTSKTLKILGSIALGIALLAVLASTVPAVGEFFAKLLGL